VTALANFTTKQFSAALSKLTMVPSRIAKPVAKSINRELQRGFDEGVDPYGKPWAPLAPRTLAKGRHPPPLTDTHAGRDGVIAAASSGAGVQITSSVSYMGIHQAGDRPRMPARKFLPWRNLPKSWAEIWELELVKATRKALSRG